MTYDPQLVVKNPELWADQLSETCAPPGWDENKVGPFSPDVPPETLGYALRNLGLEKTPSTAVAQIASFSVAFDKAKTADVLSIKDGYNHKSRDLQLNLQIGGNDTVRLTVTRLIFDPETGRTKASQQEVAVDPL